MEIAREGPQGEPLGMHVTLLSKAPYVESTKIDESYGALLATREESLMRQFAPSSSHNPPKVPSATTRSSMNGSSFHTENANSSWRQAGGVVSHPVPSSSLPFGTPSPRALRSSIMDELASELQNISAASENRTRNFYTDYSPKQFQHRLGLMDDHSQTLGDVRRDHGDSEMKGMARRGRQAVDQNNATALVEPKAHSHHQHSQDLGNMEPDRKEDDTLGEHFLHGDQSDPYALAPSGRQAHENHQHFFTAAQSRGVAEQSVPNLYVASEEGYYYNLRDNGSASPARGSGAPQGTPPPTGQSTSTPSPTTEKSPETMLGVSAIAPLSTSMQNEDSSVLIRSPSGSRVPFLDTVAFSEDTPRSELMQMVVLLRSENAKLNALMIGQADTIRTEHATELETLKEMHESEMRGKDSEMQLLRDQVRQHEATIANLFQLTNTVREDNVTMNDELHEVKERASRRERDLLNLIDKLEAQLETLEHPSQIASLNASPLRAGWHPELVGSASVKTAEVATQSASSPEPSVFDALAEKEAEHHLLVEKLHRHEHEETLLKDNIARLEQALVNTASEHNEALRHMSDAYEQQQTALTEAKNQIAFKTSEILKAQESLQAAQAHIQEADVRFEHHRHEDRTALMDTMDCMVEVMETVLLRPGIDDVQR